MVRMWRDHRPGHLPWRGSVHLWRPQRRAGEAADAADGFLWIGLKDPTDAEFDEVNDELALHPLAVEDAVKGNQRAKIEPYEGSILAVLKTLRYLEETSDVETGEVMVFVGDRFVVTVRRGEGNPLRDVRHRLELNRDQLALGPAVVLHAVMDSVVDNYVLIERALSDDMDTHRAAGLHRGEGDRRHRHLPAQARGAGVPPRGLPAGRSPGPRGRCARSRT